MRYPVTHGPRKERLDFGCSRYHDTLWLGGVKLRLDGVYPVGAVEVGFKNLGFFSKTKNLKKSEF